MSKEDKNWRVAYEKQFGYGYDFSTPMTKECAKWYLYSFNNVIFIEKFRGFWKRRIYK